MYVCILFQDNATPLCIASQKGRHDVVQSLLGAGADVNTARSDVSNETSIVLAIHILKVYWYRIGFHTLTCTHPRPVHT